MRISVQRSCLAPTTSTLRSGVTQTSSRAAYINMARLQISDGGEEKHMSTPLCRIGMMTTRGSHPKRGFCKSVRGVIRQAGAHMDRRPDVASGAYPLLKTFPLPGPSSKAGPRKGRCSPGRSRSCRSMSPFCPHRSAILPRLCGRSSSDTLFHEGAVPSVDAMLVPPGSRVVNKGRCDGQ